MADYEFRAADIDAALRAKFGFAYYEANTSSWAVQQREFMQRDLLAGTATMRSERTDMLICLRNLVSAVYHDDVDRAKAEAEAIIAKVEGSNPSPPLERDVQQDEGTF